jgi:hypothetical protein
LKIYHLATLRVRNQLSSKVLAEKGDWDKVQLNVDKLAPFCYCLVVAHFAKANVLSGRVTRLGEFSPLGDFFKITEVPW